MKLRTLLCSHALALLTACGSSQGTQESLGKARAAFGDTPDPAIMHGLYHMTMWSRTYLFPESQADVRYQLDKFGDPDESFLSKYVKKGRKPKLEWAIRLVRLPDPGSGTPEKSTNNLGTLEAMLVEGLLKPAVPPRGAVQASLKARKGFAAYLSGTMFDRVAYWYLPPDGKDPNPGRWPGFPKPKTWPVSRVPYEIPAGEKLLSPLLGHVSAPQAAVTDPFLGLGAQRWTSRAAVWPSFQSRLVSPSQHRCP